MKITLLTVGKIKEKYFTMAIDEYKKSADKNVLKLAKEFLEFQNKNIEFLKEYL